MADISKNLSDRENSGEESESDVEVFTNENCNGNEGENENNNGNEGENENNNGNEGNKNGTIEDPKKEMEFENVDDVYVYYKEYGKQEGFGVCRKSRAKTNGEVTYVTIACHRSGKSQLTAKNILKPNTITRTDCKARVCAKLCENNKWRLSTVELNHNHACSPNKSRRFRCNRIVKPHVRRQLLLHDRTGVRICENINTVVAEEGGYDEATFISKDARNIIAKERQRRLILDGGDSVALLNYFMKMQKIDNDFFYSIDLDNEKRIKNLFWADARSRAAYEEFSDVITFDTTYLTNRYDMPFAPFVGVNHHGHSTLFGCGLISHENTETFEWLFRTWLTCMKGNAPNAIITDQSLAMKNAIELVFPSARHRWCLWHIMKKIPEKLCGFEQYKSIKTCLKNIVYDSLIVDEFEINWKAMIEKFGLENNSWLKGLYDERFRWVPCFVKDHFWAGMSTTQRSESMNAFFDGYVNAKTSLKQFVEQYDNALKSKVEKEKDADFHSFSSRVQTITQYPMEKQFQSIYTISKFREFQIQLQGFMYCVPTLLESNDRSTLYGVSEIMFYGKEGESQRTVSFKVSLIRKDTDGDFDVKCVCRLFEFRGILCKHIVAVLVTNYLYANIPNKYILRRWRKDIGRRYTKTRVTYNDWGESEDGRRYDKMIKAFYDVADISYDLDMKCNIVIDRLVDLKNEILSIDGACSTQPSSSAKISDSNKGKSIEGRTIMSPIPIRCKGRPPCKRKVSKVDQVVTKKRSQKKASSGSKERNNISGIQQSTCNQTSEATFAGIVSDFSYVDLGTQQSISNQASEANVTGIVSDFPYVDLSGTQQSISNPATDTNVPRFISNGSYMDLLQSVCHGSSLDKEGHVGLETSENSP